MASWQLALINISAVAQQHGHGHAEECRRRASREAKGNLPPSLIAMATVVERLESCEGRGGPGGDVSLPVNSPPAGVAAKPAPKSPSGRGMDGLHLVGCHGPPITQSPSSPHPAWGSGPHARIQTCCSHVGCGELALAPPMQWGSLPRDSRQSWLLLLLPRKGPGCARCTHGRLSPRSPAPRPPAPLVQKPPTPARH